MFISLYFLQDFIILIHFPYVLQNITNGGFFEFLLKLQDFRAESRCPDHGLDIQFSPITQVPLQTTLSVYLGLHLSTVHSASLETDCESRKFLFQINMCSHVQIILSQKSPPFLIPLLFENYVTMKKH